MSVRINDSLNQEYYDLIQSLKNEAPLSKNKQYYTWYLKHPDLLVSLEFLKQITENSVFPKDSLHLFFDSIDKSLHNNILYQEVAQLLNTKSTFYVDLSKIKLFYESNAVLPNEDDIEYLDYIFNRTEVSDIDVITITSYCDTVGSKIYNKKLSELRALQLKKIILEKYLINSSNIKINAEGETSLAPLLKENRKSIIHIKFKTKSFDKFTLSQVNFEAGTSKILESSYAQLDSIYNILRENNFNYEVQGHVCCTNDANGMELSRERALVVYTFLINKGIDKNRLTYKGYGGNFPIDGDLSNPKNRRVELVKRD